MNGTAELSGLLRMVVFNDGCLDASLVHATCTRDCAPAPPGAVGAACTGESSGAAGWGSPSSTSAAGSDCGRAGVAEGLGPPTPTAPWQSSGLVAVALRLGLAAINPEYLPCLMDVLRVPHCVGCVGGRPNHSVFIVGTRGEASVVYLDPHTNQAACPVGTGVDGEAGIQDSTPSVLPVEPTGPGDEGGSPAVSTPGACACCVCTLCCDLELELRTPPPHHHKLRSGLCC
jgi:hypothetical protein